MARIDQRERMRALVRYHPRSGWYAWTRCEPTRLCGYHSRLLVLAGWVYQAPGGVEVRSGEPDIPTNDRPLLQRVLVANRSEIAIRVFRACTELGIRTIGICSKEDRFALHRYKADETYPLDESLGPIKAYLDIPGIISIARRTKADAIHPGYGFLAENAEFAS